METADAETTTGWKPSLGRRAFLAVVLAGAVLIPSCSEDPAQQEDPPQPRDDPEPSQVPSLETTPAKLDPYLGYSR